MKVTNLRRKLAAALAAAGMLSPGVIRAANLDTNLLANPGFESVDVNTHPPGTVAGEIAYQDPLLLNWGGTRQGFAYSHDGTNGAFNYANGTPLASGSHYYFTANAVPNAFVPPGDIDAAGQLFQDIDVSTGDSRTLIDGGAAKYNVSGFFNTYLDDNDLGHVHLDFLNGSNVSIGTAEVVAQGPLTDWVPNAASGLIPAATRTVRVSIFGVANAGGPDAYIDNVDFRVSSAVYQPTLSITVDRNTGTMTLSNLTGGAVNIKSYQVASAIESLNPDPAKWKSIADNYDAGIPGPNQVDATHNWSKLTDPVANTDLSEADLESAFGRVARGRSNGQPGKCGRVDLNPAGRPDVRVHLRNTTPPRCCGLYRQRRPAARAGRLERQRQHHFGGLGHSAGQSARQSEQPVTGRSVSAGRYHGRSPEQFRRFHRLQNRL